MAIPAYLGITVTLADTNAHKLLDLLQAVDPSVPASCKSLMIQAGDGNAGLFCYIGDSNVSPTRMGYSLALHEGNPYFSEANGLPLDSIWVLASAATVTLNVQIISL